jgi:hypothetical protein
MTGTAPHLRLKKPSGWFAAGSEINAAATLLSDPAFKVFIWLCLHAERSSGGLHVSAADIALAVRKDEQEIQNCVQELIKAGVCYWRGCHWLEISDRFWPYERCQADAQQRCSTYIAEVRAMLRRYQCVQCAFTPADEALAREWYRQGVTIEDLKRAILLGVLRKYVALLNRGAGSPITTLHYFTDLIAEVNRLAASADYWRYAACKLAELERRWIANRAAGAHALHSETK